MKEKSEEEEFTPKAGPKYTFLTQEPTISYPHPPLRQKSYNRKSEISNEDQDDEEAVSDIGNEDTFEFEFKRMNSNNLFCNTLMSSMITNCG